MTRTLVVGAGYIGAALSAHLAQSSEVWCLRRQAEALPAPVHTISVDLLTPNLADHLPNVAFDHVVFCAAANGSTQTAYNDLYVRAATHLLAALRAPGRVLFTSSTAVYAHHEGEWVDETSPTLPTDFRGSVMLAAEQLFRDSGFPHVILRLGGIYGPQRASIIKRLRDGTLSWPTSRHFTNRMHQSDIVHCIAHLLTLPQPKSTYIGVDCEPALQSAIYSYLCEKLGIAVPPLSEPLETTGRRCSNTRLLDSGFVYTYPTFREGFADLATL